MNNKNLLNIHRYPFPGKWSTKINKPILSLADLANLYSPGIAIPCKEIYSDFNKVFEYTGISNSVAVITNGTAVLGLGNLGTLASKPVMESKAALFKQCAGINAIDLEVDTEDIDTFVNTVSYIGHTFGGINLEDISAPNCFEIEKKLQKKLNIPVFHDDQHGTAIAILAGLINALILTNRTKENTKITIIGAGAAGIATANLIKDWGIPIKNMILCDSKGVINSQRQDLNPYKKEFATNLNITTIAEALDKSDILIGLSKGNIITSDMIKNMNKNPILFTLSNPNPEIGYSLIKYVHPDSIVASGGSNNDNQINNLLAFPYIFRGMLDTRSSIANLDMKIAAAQAIAELADKNKNKIVPDLLNSDLLIKVSTAVAKSAINSNLNKKIIDINKYEEYLKHILTI